MINDWLSEKKALCEKATKGPWVLLADKRSIWNQAEGLYIVPIDDMRPRRVRPENSAFIAHARTDLPKALRIIVLLRNRLAALHLVLTDEVLTQDIRDTFVQIDQIAKEQK